MMKHAFLLLSLLAACDAYAELAPRDFVDHAKGGAVLAYNVDVSRCEVHFPDTMPTYSFGEVMQGMRADSDGSGGWVLYSSIERPVNSSRYQTDNGAWRTTEVEVTPAGKDDATAVITLMDVEMGGQGKVLATGNMVCKLSTGGFSMKVLRVPRQELSQEIEVLEAFRDGQQMTYAIELNACTKGGNADSLPHRGLSAEFLDDGDSSQTWSASITDYRIPRNDGAALEFTTIVATPDFREVANIRVHSGNQVEVKTYMMYRPPRHPTTVYTLHCTFGPSGSFHVYRF